MCILKRWIAVLLMAFFTAVPWAAQAESETPCTHDLEVCVGQMRAQFADRGTLGFYMPPPDAPEGSEEVRWAVAHVVKGSGAELAGLRQYDVVTRWDGQSLSASSPESLTGQLKIGQEVTLTILRDGQEKVIKAIAHEPSEEAIEVWLLKFVRDHFDEEVYEEYKRETTRRLAASSGE